LPLVSLGGQSKFSFLTIHRSSAGAICSRLYSQHESCHQSHNDAPIKNFLVMASIVASATTGISLLSISSSPSQTLCDSTSGTKTQSRGSSQTNEGESLEEIIEAEPEIDPYDNLPEEDESTHCSICLTYRQGPCRPYWRKVEACTKDGEKERKKEEEEDDVGEKGENSENENEKDGDLSSPMSESTRCFKYMMPWIDCASKYRNLYTLIEMDTNYTEGIQELEATSHHFCWVPGQEPKIDWSNWEQHDREEEQIMESKLANLTDSDASTDNTTNVALWKTLDPTLGDTKLITVEAKVPPTINSGLGILECAYAVDQDNNVIGFAYGTKPSDLIHDENKEAENDDQTKAPESAEVGKKQNKADDVDSVGNGNEDKLVRLNIQLVSSRTLNFVLSASYTHRIEKVKSGNEDGNKKIALESHLYKSKPFTLAEIPASPSSEKNESISETSPQVVPQ